MKGSGVQRVQDARTSDLASSPLPRVAILGKKSLFPATAMKFVTNKPFSTNICINKNKTLHKLLYMPIENYIIHRDIYLLIFWEWLNMRFMSKTFCFLEHGR